MNLRKVCAGILLASALLAFPARGQKPEHVTQEEWDRQAATRIDELNRQVQKQQHQIHQVQARSNREIAEAKATAERANDNLAKIVGAKADQTSTANSIRTVTDDVRHQAHRISRTQFLYFIVFVCFIIFAVALFIASRTTRQTVATQVIREVGPDRDSVRTWVRDELRIEMPKIPTHDTILEVARTVLPTEETIRKLVHDEATKVAPSATPFDDGEIREPLYNPTPSQIIAFAEKHPEKNVIHITVLATDKDGAAWTGAKPCPGVVTVERETGTHKPTKYVGAFTGPNGTCQGALKHLRRTAAQAFTLKDSPCPPEAPKGPTVTATN